jgi:catalase (peroxidase I)
MLSFADLIQLGGYTAVEYCGGPSIEFRMGRKDIESEGEASNALVTTESSHENAVIVHKLHKMNLSPEEYVALMGSYTLGFASDDNKTKMGRWTMNPYVFDNSYFQEVLLGAKSHYLKTEGDLALLSRPEYKEWVEAYAQDENLFFLNYARAHKKVSEHGHDSLLSEYDEGDVVDGGYMENKGAHWSKRFSALFDLKSE